MSDWLDKFLHLVDQVIAKADVPSLDGGGASDGTALIWHWRWAEERRAGQILLQARPDSFREEIDMLLDASAWLLTRNDVLWRKSYRPPSLSRKAVDPHSNSEVEEQQRFTTELARELAHAWEDAHKHFNRLDELAKVQDGALRAWKQRGITIR
jgi:hypothetical protein